MKIIVLLVIVLVSLGFGSAIFLEWRSSEPDIQPSPTEDDVIIELPKPRHSSDVSIEEALLKRRSTRDYSLESLTLQEVSQLVWAAQGITDPKGFRTAPSAGALYPLEVYVVVGDVKKLAEGVYKYNPQKHELLKVIDGDKRSELAEVALEQAWIKEATINIVIAAVYERTTAKYGNRGIRYVHIEVGHAAQNICLQATALDLGIVTVGAFYDEQVKELLSLSDEEKPLYLIPIGRK
jgi:SagB-type dehydrogenase family enzyme